MRDTHDFEDYFAAKPEEHVEPISEPISVTVAFATWAVAMLAVSLIFKAGVPDGLTAFLCP